MHLNQTTWKEKKSSKEFRAFVTHFCCWNVLFWLIFILVCHENVLFYQNLPIFSLFDLFARFKPWKICYFFWFLLSLFFHSILLVFLSFCFTLNSNQVNTLAHDQFNHASSTQKFIKRTYSQCLTTIKNAPNIQNACTVLNHANSKFKQASEAHANSAISSWFSCMHTVPTPLHIFISFFLILCCPFYSCGIRFIRSVRKLTRMEKKTMRNNNKLGPSANPIQKQSKKEIKTVESSVIFCLTWTWKKKHTPGKNAFFQEDARKPILFCLILLAGISSTSSCQYNFCSSCICLNVLRRFQTTVPNIIHMYNRLYG